MNEQMTAESPYPLERHLSADSIRMRGLFCLFLCTTKQDLRDREWIQPVGEWAERPGEQDNLPCGTLQPVCKEVRLVCNEVLLNCGAYQTVVQQVRLVSKALQPVCNEVRLSCDVTFPKIA